MLSNAGFESDAAVRMLSRPLLVRLAPALVRLEVDLHPALALDPFRPARSDLALVWPLEAPMLAPAVHALFREVRIESGRPQGSQAPFRG